MVSIDLDEKIAKLINKNIFQSTYETDDKLLEKTMTSLLNPIFDEVITCCVASRSDKSKFIKITSVNELLDHYILFIDPRVCRISFINRFGLFEGVIDEKHEPDFGKDFCKEASHNLLKNMIKWLSQSDKEKLWFQLF